MYSQTTHCSKLTARSTPYREVLAEHLISVVALVLSSPGHKHWHLCDRWDWNHQRFLPVEPYPALSACCYQTVKPAVTWLLGLWACPLPWKIPLQLPVPLDARVLLLGVRVCGRLPVVLRLLRGGGCICGCMLSVLSSCCLGCTKKVLPSV